MTRKGGLENGFFSVGFLRGLAMTVQMGRLVDGFDVRISSRVLFVDYALVANNHARHTARNLKSDGAVSNAW